MYLLHSLLQSYICDVSKSKLKVNNETITQIKSLDYNQFIFVIKQFEQDIALVSNDKHEYTTLSTDETNNIHSCETYKHYPIHIKQYLDKTELNILTPYELFDIMICVKENKPLFIPIIAERIASKYNERRLHAMTLVFDTDKHIVFLHDPNSRSLFNNNDTMLLIKRYVEHFNYILQDYGMSPYTFIQYDFDYMNIDIDFIFNNSIKGNCVVASVAFMLLYNTIQEASCITNILLMTTKDDYKTLYIGLYNKLQEYLELLK